MKKILTIVFLALVALIVASAFAQENGCSNKIEEAVANCKNCNICPDGKVIEEGKVCLYLFWGQGCPHCAEEKPFLEYLRQKYPNLEVYEFEIYYNQQNANLWKDICKKYGIQPVGVPTTFVGDKAFIGFAKDCESSPKLDFSLIAIVTGSVIGAVLIIVLLLARKVRIKVKT
jgi:thiol-disulfide isomerase/thioredoxin